MWDWGTSGGTVMRRVAPLGAPDGYRARAQLVLGRAASLALLAHRSVPWWATPLTAFSLPREEKTMRILDFRFWILDC